MRRVVFLMVVMLVVLSAGVFAEDGMSFDQMPDGKRFSTVSGYYNGEVWLSWSVEERIHYTIAFFTAIRETNIRLLGNDPDGIGRMFMEELAMIIKEVTTYYESEEGDLNTPLPMMLTQAYVFIRGQ